MYKYNVQLTKKVNALNLESLKERFVLDFEWVQLSHPRNLAHLSLCTAASYAMLMNWK